jgi:hypothetical protein
MTRWHTCTRCGKYQTKYDTCLICDVRAEFEAAMKGNPMTSPEEKDYAELSEPSTDTCPICQARAIGGNDQTCDECARSHADVLAAVPAWSPRLAARAAAIVPAAKRGTIALVALTCLGLPPGAHDCTITHAWEDGSAMADCADGTYLYDADGGFVVDQGIKYFYRPEGTWYVAPQRAS